MNMNNPKKTLHYKDTSKPPYLVPTGVSLLVKVVLLLVILAI